MILALVVFLVVVAAATGGTLAARAQGAARPVTARSSFEGKADLGRTLFFDPRLSGDGATACSTCHVPEKAWTDGLALSAGYTSVLYFRNTPTLLNASKSPLLDWDGRFEGRDMDSVVRDHLAEAHFMNVDGLLLVERLRQVPGYEAGFKELYGSEVNYGKILNAISEYVATMESKDHPYLKYRAGDRSALSPQAKAGLDLFEGQAGCSSCHSGDLLTYGGLHALGVPENPEIFKDPTRHVTFRRFFKQFGVGDFAGLREDPGQFALTHEEADRGKFRTPSLLEVARTGPYMHNGVFGTLEEVVRFYNEGGGQSPNKDPRLRPLGLNESEVSALIAFLETLRSTEGAIDRPTPPPYQLRELGSN